MTIFVTWQLRVTLDSIRNSCDVFYRNPHQHIFRYKFQGIVMYCCKLLLLAQAPLRVSVDICQYLWVLAHPSRQFQASVLIRLCSITHASVPIYVSAAVSDRCQNSIQEMPNWYNPKLRYCSEYVVIYTVMQNWGEGEGLLLNWWYIESNGQFL